MTLSLAAQLRVKRSEMMLDTLEAVALRLFERRGFANVTVDDIANAAHISARTFYRYFPTKEDVLQARILRRTEELRTALAARPVDELGKQARQRSGHVLRLHQGIHPGTVAPSDAFNKRS